MGIPLALALLTILFHHHNHKHTPSSYILSVRASLKADDTTYNQEIRFGIMRKSDLPSKDSWIFAKKVNLSECTNIIQMTNVQLNTEIDAEQITLQDLIETLQSAIHLARSLQELGNYSPLLNQSMLPFMSAVSCLFSSCWWWNICLWRTPTALT